MDQPASPSTISRPPQSTLPPQPEKKRSKVSLFLLIGMILLLILILGEVIYLAAGGNLPFSNSESQTPSLDQDLFPALTPTPQSESPSASESAAQNNIQRRSDLNVILNTLVLYRSENQGNLPSGITTETKTISSADADICSALVPYFTAALPTDPLTRHGNIVDCDTFYDTGYTISVSGADHTITATAPLAQLEETIEVSR